MNMAGKRFITLQDLTFQGKAIPKNTVGQFLAVGSQLNNQLAGQSTSGSPSTVILNFLLNPSGSINMPMTMEVLSQNIADVDMNTPLSKI